LQDEENFEIEDPTELEYDPARRRRMWLFDPGPRRRHRTHTRKRRKGRMPAGLRRYWAARGRRFDPARRRRRRGRRFRRFFDPIRRRGRRHFDIAAPGNAMEDFEKSGLVTAGSMAHNYLVHGQGILARTYSLGPVNVTQLGALSWLLPPVARWLGFRMPPWLREIFAGMAAEATNVPAVESIARSGPTGAGGTGGYAFGSAAVAMSPTGVGPAGYVPVWAYT
jgi:hypothetical protein